MLRERLPTPSPPLLSLPNRRSSYLRCALRRSGRLASGDRHQIACRRIDRSLQGLSLDGVWVPADPGPPGVLTGFVRADVGGGAVEAVGHAGNHQAGVDER
jgi:hypothetical protein